ncbi:MAG TPA: hypothetical protein VE010_23270, partial [Thermoanaerobaculia bacterium]|nr:hypothetical protein [Thermoanaerobaculia bacterium]
VIADKGVDAYRAAKAAKAAKQTEKAADAKPLAKASSKYDDITAKKSRYENRSTDATRKDFDENLQANGYTKTATQNGKATNYSNGTTNYAVRDSAKSTGGPSADVSRNGTIIKKIRLEDSTP